MPFGKILKIAGTATATEDERDRNEQQQQLGIANNSNLSALWQGLQKGDQIRSGIGAYLSTGAVPSNRHRHGRISRTMTEFQTAVAVAKIAY